MVKLAIVGCKHTTKDLIEGLLEIGFKIDSVITIDSRKANEQKVAGYFDLRPFLKEKNIPVYVAEKYSLNSEKDRARIDDLKLGVLLCMGWQRLIPEWLLNSLEVGAFGMHGSNKPLPHGRGRSPMNWSLIQNKKVFFTHLFKYKPGVDDGDVVAYQVFDITPFDNAHSLHFKNLTAMIKLCEKELSKILLNNFKTYPQKSIEPSFYPKRSAEDGIIFWHDSSDDIYNLCRAVTYPFPGAFTFLDEIKVLIWECVPFDTHLRWDKAETGEICTVFYDGSFVVKTGDTSVLVKKYEVLGSVSIIKGKKFQSLDYKRKTWANLPT